MHLRDPICSPQQKSFKRDLWHFVEAKVKQEGEEVLIVGDFKEVFGSEIDGISKLAADFNLINLMNKARHSGHLPPTYSRGWQCLDYGLGRDCSFFKCLMTTMWFLV